MMAVAAALSWVIKACCAEASLHLQGLEHYMSSMHSRQSLQNNLSLIAVQRKKKFLCVLSSQSCIQLGRLPCPKCPNLGQMWAARGTSLSKEKTADVIRSQRCSALHCPILQGLIPS